MGSRRGSREEVEVLGNKELVASYSSVERAYGSLVVWRDCRAYPGVNEEAQHRVNRVMRVRGAPTVLAKVGVKEEEI